MGLTFIICAFVALLASAWLHFRYLRKARGLTDDASLGQDGKSIMNAEEKVSCLKAEDRIAKFGILISSVALLVFMALFFFNRRELYAWLSLALFCLVYIIVAAAIKRKS